MTSEPETPTDSRRYFAEHRRELFSKIREYARADDESGFVEHVLHRLNIWEDMPQFEKALAIFREIRLGTLGQRGWR
jgi:hypothetical protein